MFMNYSLWKSILLFVSSTYLTIAVSNNHRENLARRHPCNSINKRLEPYIKWTEKLASTQYKVQKDACGQINHGPACCTNEIFNSYASSLGTDLKTLYDAELDRLVQLLSLSNRDIEIWINENLNEARRVTITSLETLFGTKEFHSNMHHSISTLFTTLGNHQSSDQNVSQSAVNLFHQLIISSYRRFMTDYNDIILDDRFQKCLVNKAFDIGALPMQRELLYTLTSAASLMHILRTLFIYIEADIQRLKTTVTLNSHQCLQRYVRETLCPICVNKPSSLSSSISYENNVNEPLCENDCHYVIKTCFNQTHNPYVAFALIAQGYSNVIKQIQESAVELKLVERLSKLHIYLYDMVVNAANTRKTYTLLQHACPNPNEKAFTSIRLLAPIISERRELVIKWNNSFHYMLDRLQSSINSLNQSLTQQIITSICLNPKYAVKSNRCTQIDQHTPGDFTQWPLPPFDPSSQITSDLNIESIRNQLGDLKKKISPIHEMIVSLRPKEKPSMIGFLPNFDYESEVITNDNDIQQPSLFNETYENNHQGSLSEKLYKEFDGQTTHQSTTIYPDEKDANHSHLITYNIPSILIVFTILIIHRISFTNKRL